MKRLIVFIALLCAATLSSTATPPTTNAAEGAKKEQAVVKFDEPVMLMGVTLKGTYLFVHDDEAMARGEACTYVYQGTASVRDKLVVSFHCTPKERSKATRFTMRSIQTAPGLNELTEFQFIGSTEGHLVPVMVN